MNTQDVMQRLIRYNVGIQANKRLLMNHFHKCKTMTVTITRKVFIDNYISGPGQKITNQKLVHETLNKEHMEIQNSEEDTDSRDRKLVC